jgi:hypothetical protein
MDHTAEIQVELCAPTRECDYASSDDARNTVVANVCCGVQKLNRSAGAVEGSHHRRDRWLTDP